MLYMINISGMWMHKYLWICWCLWWRKQQWLCKMYDCGECTNLFSNRANRQVLSSSSNPTCSEYRNSRLQIILKIRVLKNFAIFTEKHLVWNLFLIKSMALRPATLLKKDFNTCFIMWILRKFYEHLFL